MANEVRVPSRVGIIVVVVATIALFAGMNGFNDSARPSKIIHIRIEDKMSPIKIDVSGYPKYKTSAELLFRQEIRYSAAQSILESDFDDIWRGCCECSGRGRASDSEITFSTSDIDSVKNASLRKFLYAVTQNLYRQAGFK